MVTLQNHLIQMVTDVDVLMLLMYGVTMFYVENFPGHKKQTIYGINAFAIYFRTVLVVNIPLSKFIQCK